MSRPPFLMETTMTEETKPADQADEMNVTITMPDGQEFQTTVTGDTMTSIRNTARYVKSKSDRAAPQREVKMLPKEEAAAAFEQAAPKGPVPMIVGLLIANSGGNAAEVAKEILERLVLDGYMVDADKAKAKLIHPHDAQRAVELFYDTLSELHRFKEMTKNYAQEGEHHLPILIADMDGKPVDTSSVRVQKRFLDAALDAQREAIADAIEELGVSALRARP